VALGEIGCVGGDLHPDCHCHAHGVDQQAYLADVLACTADHPASRLDQLISLLCPRSRLKQQFSGTASVSRAVMDRAESCTGLGTALETTVDQALIPGLGTALRVFVSGLSSV
jgi:hypothetical protein